MNKKIFDGIFSISGISIVLGTFGGLSAIVTMFVDVNIQLSVKWLLLTVLISVSLIFILQKLIYDLSNEVKPPQAFENPTHSYPEEQVFIIKRNDNFINNIMVGCYYQSEEREELAYVGQVDSFQPKIIQIKIVFDCEILDFIPDTPQTLKNIVIRPVIPVSIFNKLKE